MSHPTAAQVPISGSEFVHGVDQVGPTAQFDARRSRLG